MDDRVLLLALRGRDASVIDQLLARAGHTRHICESMSCLTEQLELGAGAVLVTEESLGDGDCQPLYRWLEAQEPWSDLPFVLLATKRRGKRPPEAVQVLESLGNFVVLERPIHSETLISAVNSALRVRKRQYLARQHLDQLKATEESLIALNASLETRVNDRTAERDRLWRLSEDMLARADYEGGLHAVSPSWTRVLGYTEQELLSRPYVDIIHPDNVEDVGAALDTMRQTGQPTRFENKILAAEGTWKPIGWTVSPENDGVHFIAIGRDLSSEKAREAELARSQEQLRQAHKMEAVGQLTGGIAHDFNNLLQGITGSLEIVQRRVATGRLEDLERFISGAMTSANRAAALTHRLLAFSRRQPLDPKPVAANPLIGSMEDLLRRTLGESIALELRLADDLWPTLCDINQLESAILNLAINARDAMPQGGVLTIETANIPKQDRDSTGEGLYSVGDHVRIAVTDTGCGMSSEVIERAFDPFFTTKAIGEGTGLGLSMIYGFARQSEGYAEITSEEGAGTTVSLYLPRHDTHASEVMDEPDLGELHSAQEGEVVVVIDDEPLVRGLIVEVLEELGYQALEADDGPSGLALLTTTKRVDLLVTDIGLPGLNGRQVADQARETRPDLKILFMTGYAENAMASKGFLGTNMALITKPFTMEALTTRIREIIEDG